MDISSCVPSPGAGPRVSFDENELGSGTSGTDSIDTGLVEVEDEGLIHIVVLIVGVYDSMRKSLSF